MKQMVEGIDYYYDGANLVLTAHYHTERGYCCGLGCRHCPYRYENVPEPRRTLLLKEQKDADQKKSSPS
ncbi:MAG: DUF5522 domain-containing protein [Lacibacter sp.]